MKNTNNNAESVTINSSVSKSYLGVHTIGSRPYTSNKSKLYSCIAHKSRQHVERSETSKSIESDLKKSGVKQSHKLGVDETESKMIISAIQSKSIERLFGSHSKEEK